MEPWKNSNYYTTNTTIVVELMNASTIEWNIGPLPPHLVAIPGSLNESYNFPSEAIIIENVSQVRFGGRDIEKVIFGATSGFVLICAFAWLAWRKYEGKLLSPRGSSVPAENESEVTSTQWSEGAMGDGSVELGLYGFGSDKFLPAKKFEDELSIYYDNVKTESELYRKTLADGVTPEDVEAGTELLRRLYDLQLKIWSESGSPEISQEQRDLDEDQRDALLADYGKLVSTWVNERDVIKWEEEEMRELMDLAKKLGELPARGKVAATAR